MQYTTEAQSFMESAACRGMDPELFYPHKGDSPTNAKQVCYVCQVKRECLEYALQNNERDGIWGGASERERRQIKRERSRAIDAVARTRRTTGMQPKQRRSRPMRDTCCHGHSRAEHWRKTQSGQGYCKECMRLNGRRQRDKMKALLGSGAADGDG